jgi:hypothetical protein
MAQTGFTPISTYYTTTASAVPTAGNLVNGELALNISTSDGKLFYKDSAGVVQVLATKGSATVGGSTTQVQYNNAGVLAGSANFVFDGTKVGVGTSSPTAVLDVVTDSSATGISLRGRSSDSVSDFSIKSNDGATVYGQIQGRSTDLRIQSNSAIPTTFFTNSSERMRIDSAGNVGIGTSNPSGYAKSAVVGSVGSNTLYVGSATQGVYIQNSTGNDVVYNASGSNAGAHVWQTGNAERMRIAAGGELLIGTTSNIAPGASVAMLAGGNVLHIRSLSSGANNFVSYNSSGTATFSVSNGGAVSKTSGSFKIDHPLPEKSETHHLVHSFVEAPQADNIYRGKTLLINGKAEVNIDLNSGMTEGTFIALNREVQCFTSNETDWDAVRGSVNGNILTIECQNQSSTANISWLVIGERQDKHMYETDWTDENGKVIVEPLKVIEDKSK